MEESTGYEKLRSQMEETLWHLNQRKRTLQEHRQEIERQWDDQASYYINGRYLNPHAEDSEQMSQLLRNQQETLKQADQQMVLARNYQLEVIRLSQEIETLIHYVQEDLKRSYHDHQVYMDNNLAAQAELPAIAQLLSQANNAC